MANGCATVATLSERWHGHTTTNWDTDPPRQEKAAIIYGGTRMDVRLLAAWKSILFPEASPPGSPYRVSNEWAPVGACVGTIDLVPSLVLDTLLLPVTLVWTLIDSQSDADALPPLEEKNSHEQK